MAACVIGVNVGRTNTDAVVLSGKDIKAKAKVSTTWDVTTGVSNAVIAVLENYRKENPSR